MLETTYFEGKDYLKGKEYTVEDKVGRALGPSVQIIKEKKEDKKKEKMVEGAKNTMVTGSESDVENK